MKKRSLSLLLALVLLVSLTALTGCKSNDSKTPTQNITAYTLKNEKDPVATITMENGGVITVELYPDVAPNTVANFITLANQGFYEGLHDSGRRPKRQWNRRLRLLHQGRVFRQRL